MKFNLILVGVLIFLICTLLCHIYKRIWNVLNSELVYFSTLDDFFNLVFKPTNLTIMIFMYLFQ